MIRRWTIYIGFDPREAAAYAVCRASIERHLTIPIPIFGLDLAVLKARRLFTRPQEVRDGHLWDVISDAPCSTEFSLSRFLVPHLAGDGLALFMDCDMLVRANLVDLFWAIEDGPAAAVHCVQHRHAPSGPTKMDGCVQTAYARKNWSSLMVFDCDHVANRRLTLDLVNTAPGRDLHAFNWLRDEEIGAIDPAWNWLAGEQPEIPNPKIVHHTLGSPCLPGYEHAPYADEWRAELRRWAA